MYLIKGSSALLLLGCRPIALAHLHSEFLFELLYKLGSHARLLRASSAKTFYMARGLGIILSKPNAPQCWLIELGPPFSKDLEAEDLRLVVIHLRW